MTPEYVKTTNVKELSRQPTTPAAGSESNVRYL